MCLETHLASPANSIACAGQLRLSNIDDHHCLTLCVLDPGLSKYRPLLSDLVILVIAWTHLKQATVAGVLELMRTEPPPALNAIIAESRRTIAADAPELELTRIVAEEVCKVTGLHEGLERANDKLVAAYSASNSLARLGAEARALSGGTTAETALALAHRSEAASKAGVEIAAKRSANAIKMPTGLVEREAMMKRLIAEYAAHEEVGDWDGMASIPRPTLRQSQQEPDLPGTEGWKRWFMKLKPGTEIWKSANAGGEANHAWRKENPEEFKRWRAERSRKAKEEWAARGISYGSRDESRWRGSEITEHTPEFAAILSTHPNLLEPTEDHEFAGKSLPELFHELAQFGGRSGDGGGNRTATNARIVAWHHKACGSRGVSKVSANFVG